MDFDFRCNRLSCRKSLTEKAVVTTCSHIFCAHLGCVPPARHPSQNRTSLVGHASRRHALNTQIRGESDDVVVSSLHPSNDYRTSVLSGLNPATILEICSRAISFWQYQIHQENSFQHAVVRSVNDKNAQLQKQLENLVREADGEINLLSGKLSDFERDLDLERRKNRDLQETSRERDKEYQKLKAQYDKLKRRALLAPTGQPGINITGGPELPPGVNTMEMNGRTPMANRTAGQFGTHVGQPLWSNHSHPMQQQQQQHASAQNAPPVRQPFVASERSLHLSASERSNSTQEVEELLGSQGRMQRKASYQGGWASTSQSQQRVFAPSTGRRASGVFKPGGRGK